MDTSIDEKRLAKLESDFTVWSEIGKARFGEMERCFNLIRDEIGKLEQRHQQLRQSVRC